MRVETRLPYGTIAPGTGGYPETNGARLRELLFKAPISSTHRQEVAEKGSGDGYAPPARIENIELMEG